MGLLDKLFKQEDPKDAEDLYDVPNDEVKDEEPEQE